MYFKKMKKDGWRLLSPYQNHEWSRRKWVEIDNFDESDVECSHGLYYLKLDQLLFCPNTPIFEVEIDGKIKEFVDKNRCSRMRIIREIEKGEILDMIRVADLDKSLGFKYVESLFPYHPLQDHKKNKPQPSDVESLKKWASVWASVWDSVRDSVRDSVWDSVWALVWDSVRASVGASVRASVWASVGASVWDSVGASVGASVRASVGAYTGSLFPNIQSRKYISHEEGEYPFQPAVDLWYCGFVPSFDGKTWRLHSGRNAAIVYELGHKEE